MARARDLWFSEVPVKDADGNVVLDEHGLVTTQKVKSARHPGRGGSKGAKRWLAVWIDPDGNERSKVFAKQSEAKAYADKMEADARRGEYVDKDAGKAKFGDIARTWLRLRDVGALSRERYESVFRIHVDPVFGNRQIGAIMPSDIDKWLKTGPISGLGDEMRETAYFIVAGTLDLAVADQLRRDNPARHKIVSKPKVEPKERAHWQVETVWRVRDEHPEPYRAIVDVEAGLGLRRGCAFGLAEDDLDFEAGKARVRRQIAFVGGQWVFKAPKGGKERTVPMARGVAASLEAHMAKYPPVECTLPWCDEKGNIGDPVTARLLFVWRGGHRVSGKPLLRESTFGKPIRAGTYDQGVWKPALSRAGVLPPPEKNARGGWIYKIGDRKGTGQHVLRHFFQTVLDDAGVSLAARMEFMGHSKKGKVVTIASYGHVTEESFESARNAVDRTLFKLRKIEPTGTVTEIRAAQ